MYRCETCQKVVSPGVKQHRVVTALRIVKFPYREDAYQREGLWFDDVGGDGTQIAREQAVCGLCAATSREPMRPRLPLPKAKRTKQKGRRHRRRERVS
jgi:hypothetical protein